MLSTILKFILERGYLRDSEYRLFLSPHFNLGNQNFYDKFIYNSCLRCVFILKGTWSSVWESNPLLTLRSRLGRTVDNQCPNAAFKLVGMAGLEPALIHLRCSRVETVSDTCPICYYLSILSHQKSFVNQLVSKTGLKPA